MSLVLGILLATAAIADAGALGRLEGLARDENGNALPGVTVGVHSVSGTLDRAATTDARGRVSVGELPPGRYQVDFRLPSFATSMRTVEVPESRSISVEATLRVALTADVLVTGRRTFRNLSELNEPVNGLLRLAEARPVGVVT